MSGPIARLVASVPRTLVKELGAFGVVGAVGLVLDVVLFQVLYVQAGMEAVPAKLLATAASTTFAYVAHRTWSFSHRRQLPAGRAYAIFVVVNVLTLLLNLGAVAFVRHTLHRPDVLLLQVANIASIGVGTIIRFVAYRRWVFPAPLTAGSTGQA